MDAEQSQCCGGRSTLAQGSARLVSVLDKEKIVSSQNRKSTRSLSLVSKLDPKQLEISSNSEPEAVKLLEAMPAVRALVRLRHEETGKDKTLTVPSETVHDIPPVESLQEAREG